MESAMPPLVDDLIKLVNESPGMTDRELTDALKGKGVHPSQANQEARHLEQKGLLVRRPRNDGFIGNYPSAPEEDAARIPEKPQIIRTAEGLSEDEVKAHLATWLQAQGWEAIVAWGKSRGVDILATQGEQRWIIEVKGLGSLQPMRVNYFISMLGETLQRMADPEAKYSIAMPDIAQFRGLWKRLPQLAKQRTQITALFVTSEGAVSEGSHHEGEPLGVL
jgi:hypothetical protein